MCGKRKYFHGVLSELLCFFAYFSSPLSSSSASLSSSLRFKYIFVCLHAVFSAVEFEFSFVSLCHYCVLLVLVLQLLIRCMFRSINQPSNTRRRKTEKKPNKNKLFKRESTLETTTKFLVSGCTFFSLSRSFSLSLSSVLFLPSFASTWNNTVVWQNIKLTTLIEVKWKRRNVDAVDERERERDAMRKDDAENEQRPFLMKKNSSFRFVASAGVIFVTTQNVFRRETEPYDDLVCWSHPIIFTSSYFPQQQTTITRWHNGIRIRSDNMLNANTFYSMKQKTDTNTELFHISTSTDTATATDIKKEKKANWLNWSNLHINNEFTRSFIRRWLLIRIVNWRKWNCFMRLSAAHRHWSQNG